MVMTSLRKRDFMKLVAGAVAFPSIIPANALGQNGTVAPSNQITVGLIGCGRRSGVGKEYNMVKQSRLLAVCDPVKWRRDAHAKEWEIPDAYNDFRDVLARDDIDAVHIVTPDHWHVPIALMAARAGKDMYVEKPLGLSIGQSLASREITEKHGRVFQYGTQQRSMRHLRMGIEMPSAMALNRCHRLNPLSAWTLSAIWAICVCVPVKRWAGMRRRKSSRAVMRR